MLPDIAKPPMMRDDPNMPLEFKKHKDRCKGMYRDFQEVIFMNGECTVIECLHVMKRLTFCCADKYNKMSYSCHLYMDPKRKNRYDNYFHYYDKETNFKTYADPYVRGGRMSV